MNPPTLTFMTNADDQRSLKTERLGEVLGRVVWRLTTQRNSGSACYGSSHDDERGAATGTYTPAATGERGHARGRGDRRAARNDAGSAGGNCTLDLLGMNQASYYCSTAHELEIAGSIEARTAGPSPVKAPQGGPAAPLG